MVTSRLRSIAGSRQGLGLWSEPGAITLRMVAWKGGDASHVRMIFAISAMWRGTTATFGRNTRLSICSLYAFWVPQDDSTIWQGNRND
jgi:hypothetical protein